MNSPGKRSGFRLLALLVALAIVSSSCGSDSTEADGGSTAADQDTAAVEDTAADEDAAADQDSEATGEVVELVWWSAYTGSVADKLAWQVEQFNDSHPDIHVTNLQIPGGSGNQDAERKFLTAVAAGEGPDIYTSSNPVVANYAEAGAILPLDEYLTGDYAGLVDWLYPAAAEGGMYQGVLYGLPQSMNSQNMLYNISMLEEQGLDEPPATLAEFDEVQAAMWDYDGNQVRQVGFFPEPSRFTLYMSFFGCDLNLNDEGRYDLSGNAGCLSLMEYYEKYQEYPLSAFTAFQSAVGAGDAGGNDPFTAGKQGFYIVGPWEGRTTIPAGNPDMVGNFSAANFPTVPGGPTGPSTFVNGNYDFMAAGTEHPAEAFTFLAWLSGWGNPDINGEVMALVGWLPGAPEVSESDTYQAFLAEFPWAQVMVDAFASPDAVAAENTLGMAQVFDALNTVCEAVLTGQMTPEEALAYVDEQGNNALDEAGG